MVAVRQVFAVASRDSKISREIIKNYCYYEVPVTTDVVGGVAVVL